MQDTKNLEKRLKEYESDLLFALRIGDHSSVNWYNDQIEWTKKRIKSRENNGVNNV